MSDRPSCYPEPPLALLSGVGQHRLPLLDVLTSPVPRGLFDSPVDDRHVLCLHLGDPIPVSYRAGNVERQGVRIHGQFCVVPAGSSTRWTLTRPARSLLLRVASPLVRETAEVMGLGSQGAELAPSIHIRDPQVERIGWMMQAEDHDAYPGAGCSPTASPRRLRRGCSPCSRARRHRARSRAVRCPHGGCATSSNTSRRISTRT